MDKTIRDLNALGQSVWYDNVERGQIVSGEIGNLIHIGISGLTSNPTIFNKTITGSSDYDEQLKLLLGTDKRPNEIYEAMAIKDIQSVADILFPVYKGTNGEDGYASLEVNPQLAQDTNGTVAEARRLFKRLDRPNVMIKVPATPEGIPAIRQLIGDGINVNITLIFSLLTYRDVRRAYISGLEDLQRSGGDITRVSSVASFFVSRVDTAVDDLLTDGLSGVGQKTEGLFGKAAIANAKLAYRDFCEDFYGDLFTTLRSKGGRVQRPLWASTSTKNPEYRDVLYCESLIGSDTVNTMPYPTIQAFLDHGHVASTLGENIEDAEVLFKSLENVGIKMENVAAKLLENGLKLFADSFVDLIATISDQKSGVGLRR